MNTFKKWNGHAVEDLGAFMSRDAKNFVTAFRNMLKRQLGKEGINVVRFTPNHYECSGFVEKDGRYVYISYSIPRYGQPIDFNSNCYTNGVLYRVAETDQDFCGGQNHFCSIWDLPQNIINIFRNKNGNVVQQES